MDWFNRIDVVRDKIKFQLVYRGVDSIGAIEKYFKVHCILTLGI